MRETAAPQICPEPAVLGAYAEGRVSADIRVEVERHIADCGECAIVIGETFSFLEEDVAEDEEGDARSHPTAGLRHTWRVMAAALVVAVSVPLILWRVNVARDPLYALRRAVAASEARPVAGMLEGFAHRPTGPRAGDQAQTTIELRAAAEQIRNIPATDAAAVHARGVAEVLSGNTNVAIATLRAAAEADGRQAAYWNDLAVAQLAAEKYADALQSANRAVALAPSSASGHFNRGVALERLRRDDEARRAYAQALASKPSAAWRNELNSRIEVLSSSLPREKK